MRRMTAPAVLVGILGTLGSASLQAEDSFLSIVVSEFSVEISAMTPGASVAVLAADRQKSPVDDYLTQVTIVELLADDDGDGTVAYERGTVASQASVWVAVEVESGRVGSATSFGDPVPAFESPLGLATPIETGPTVVAVEGHEAVQLLLVRPGVGAWSALGVDGGLSEESGVANGRVTFYEPAWDTLSGDEAGPGSRIASDLLFALDPKTFTADARRAGDLVRIP